MRNFIIMRRRPARTLVASAVAAWIFLLQSSFLAIAPTVSSLHSKSGSGAGAALASKYCQTGPDDGGKTPIDQRRDDSQCCLACGQSARDVSYLFIAALLGGTSFLAPEGAESFLVHVIIQRLKGRPIGWASTWSSRAPPTFF
jgi:hypothetical protein